MVKRKETTPKKVTTKKTDSRKVKKTSPKKVAKKADTSRKVAVKKTAAKSNKKQEISKTKLLADAAVDGILEVKGKNIVVLNLENIHNRVCDYFIICQADSNTQVNAIAHSVEKIVQKNIGEKPYRSEGFENSEWILIDYVTVVVHIFQSHIREFYNLESLWADAEITKIAFD